MAITIAPLPRFIGHNGPLRGEKLVSRAITPDGSKPSGGYTVLASSFGLTYLDFGVCGAVNDGSTYVAGLKVGTASTDCTIQFYSYQSVAGSAATAGAFIAVAASDTKLTTNPVTVLVCGR